MSEISAPAPAPAVTAASGAQIRRGFFPLYALANFGMWLAIYTPALVTLAVRVRQVDPQGATGALGTITGIAALFAMFGNPFFGKLSDRSMSRWGMRRPYFVGGMIVGTAALAVMGTASNLVVLGAGWCLAQLGYNAAAATMTAVVADQVPEHRRGRIAGVIGFGNFLAMAIGAYVANWFSGDVLLMFLAPALIGIAPVLLYAFTMPDRRRTTAPTEPYGVREFFTSFWVDPLRHRDFGWAWLSRFMIVLAWMTLLTYQAYLLIDRFHVTAGDVAVQVATSTTVMVAGILVGSSAGGWLSDRLNRRKPFVVAAAAIAAVGFPLVAVSANLGQFYTGVAVLGLGIGVHMSVDLALITEVLPDPEDSAKDLGVFNIANALPQSVAPAVAPLILTIGTGGRNYTALYLAAAVFALLGAVAVQRVRGVR